MSWGRFTVFASIAIVAAAYVVAVAPTFVGFPDELNGSVRTTLLENVPGGDSVTSGALGMTLSHSSLAFGSLAPGESSAAVELRITNSGAVPLGISISASPMTDAESGAQIPSARISYSASDGGSIQTLAEERDVSGLSLLPGESSSIFLRLKAPPGGAQWIPAGDYEGSITVTARGL